MGPRGYDEIKTLAKTTNTNIPDVLALTANNDPFFSGSKAHIRAGEWFAEQWERFGGAGGHIRRVHYRMLEQGIMLPTGDDGRARGEMPYVNDKTSWAALSMASKYARHLEFVDPEDFVDRRNEPVRPYGEIVRHADEPTWEWWPADWSAPHLPAIEGLPKLSAPTAGGYDYDRASDQPATIEVWVEKTGVDDVLDPLCRSLGVNLVTGKGYESITAAIALLHRASSRPVRILYVSDHDNAGLTMPVAIGRQVEFYRPIKEPDADVMIDHVVLTEEQITEYRLPHAPDSMKVELDALESLHPGELAKIVRHAVESWRDRDIGARLSDANQEADGLLTEAWDREVADEISQRLAELRKRATRERQRFAPYIALLNTVMASQYAPIVAEYDDLVAELQGIADDLDVDLPDRPEGEMPDVDTDGYVFDSARDYFDQLDAYKTHKKRSA